MDLATAPAPASTLPNDKILITIRHPPTEKENKFKVKGTHTVGRVLSSACVAFGLNPNGCVHNPFSILLASLCPIRKANIIFITIFVAPH
jgi:hypothetical protein